MGAIGYASRRIPNIIPRCHVASHLGLQVVRTGSQAEICCLILLPEGESWRESRRTEAGQRANCWSKLE